MSDEFKFNDEALNLALGAIKPVMEEDLKLLEQTNSDIKNMEQLLTKYPSKGLVYFMGNHVMGWCNKRIRFGSLHTPLDLCKPLMEQKVHIRLAIREHLPKFLKHIYGVENEHKALLKFFFKQSGFSQWQIRQYFFYRKSRVE